jgi:hypothetical protein
MSVISSGCRREGYRTSYLVSEKCPSPRSSQAAEFVAAVSMVIRGERQSSSLATIFQTVDNSVTEIRLLGASKEIGQ